MWSLIGIWLVAVGWLALPQQEARENKLAIFKTYREQDGGSCGKRGILIKTNVSGKGMMLSQRVRKMAEERMYPVVWALQQLEYNLSNVCRVRQTLFGAGCLCVGA